jgi:hypothetical protein
MRELKMPEILTDEEIEDIVSHGNQYIGKYYPQLADRLLPLADCLHVQRISGYRELISRIQQADLKWFLEWLDEHRQGQPNSCCTVDVSQWHLISDKEISQLKKAGEDK